MPGEDDDHLPVVKAAIKAGIPVLDITQGLADYELPKDPAKDSGDTGPNGEKIPARRTRGKARTTSQVAAELEKDTQDDPPWNTDDEPESPSKAPAKPDTQSPTDEGGQPAAASSDALSPNPAGGMAVVLSQATIEAVLQAFALMAADIKASVVEELPASVKPKPVLYPYYYNEEEGTYRPVTGRGRPKTGEKRVELTSLEIEEFGL